MESTTSRRTLRGCSAAIVHPTRPPQSDPTTTAEPAKVGTVLFSPEGNNLWAYDTTPPFRSQKINTANHSFGDAPSDPKGWDINGQMCTFSMGTKRYLISGATIKRLAEACPNFVGIKYAVPNPPLFTKIVLEVGARPFATSASP